jgi:hypothetical protein
VYYADHETAVLTAGAVLATAFGGVGLIFETAATTMATSASDDLLTVLERMVTFADSTLLYWGLGLFVGAASIAMLRSSSFGVGFTSLGLVAAVLMFLGAGWPLTGDDRGPVALVGLLGLTLLAVWILRVALEMTRSTPRSAVKQDSTA